MSDQFLDHPILSSRYFYPCPNRFEKSFFVEGNAVTSAVVNGKPVTIGDADCTRLEREHQVEVGIWAWADYRRREGTRAGMPVNLSRYCLKPGRRKEYGIGKSIDLYSSAAIGGIGHGLRDDIDRYSADLVRVGSRGDCRSGCLHEGRQMTE